MGSSSHNNLDVPAGGTKVVRHEDAGSSTNPAQQEPLRQAEHLFWHGKFPEALEHLEQLEAQETLSKRVQVQSQLLQCRIYAYIDVKKALTLTTQVIQMSQDLDLSLIRVDALLVMAETLQYLGKFKASQPFVEQGRTVLATIPNTMVPDLTAREATVLALEGGIYTYTGPTERAIESLQQSLRLREQRGKPQEIAHSFCYLGRAYSYQSEIKRAVDLLQQSLTITEQLQHPPAIAHSRLWLGLAYMMQGERERSLECFQQSLAIYEQLGIQHGMAHSLSWIGMNYVSIGELKRASEVLRTSWAICENLGISGTWAETLCVIQFGRLYLVKGELEDALECFQNALALSEEQGYQTGVGFCLRNLGTIHMKKGQLEVALEYMVKGLKVQEELGNDFFIVSNLYELVIISLELEQLETARRYVHRLKEFQDHLKTYNLARAMLLKASPRTRDKMKAQELFQQLAEDSQKFVTYPPSRQIAYTVQASLSLCELLFFEFKTSEDPAILHEIQTVTNRLLDLAQTQHAAPILAETYLLQAKLALLDLDVPRAQQLLTEAQAIAEEKGLQLLTRSISDEHDTLQRQINQWKAIQAQNVSPDEVSELADLKAQVVRMIHTQLNDVSYNLLKEITTSFQIPTTSISEKTHPPKLNDRILHKFPDFKYDTISTAIINCLKKYKRLNISQLTEEVRIQRGRASRRIIRERVNHLINEGLIEELDEGFGRQLRVIPLSDNKEPHLEK